MSIRLRLRLAAIAVALGIVGAIAAPTMASAATVTPQGLNTCKVWYTYENPPGYNPVACAFSPSNIACFAVKVKHVSCTRY